MSGTGHGSASPAVDQHVPPTSPGLLGRLERFMGPGETRAESAVEAAGVGLGATLLFAGTWSTDALRGWSGLQLAVGALIALDLLGGILTNTPDAAKRAPPAASSSPQPTPRTSPLPPPRLRPPGTPARRPGGDGRDAAALRGRRQVRARPRGDARHTGVWFRAVAVAA